MKFSFKPTFTQCILICIVFIVIGLFIANYLKPNTTNTSANTTTTNTTTDTAEKYGYPYYPHIYESVPEYIYPNDPLIRNQGNGDLLVWNKNPIMPLLVKCRNGELQSDICKYIRGNQNVYSTTP